MRTLIIDTATRACSVALLDGDTVIAESHEIIGRGHAERLLVDIAALPDKGRADRIAVNVGPGSFTGIRVGISAAKALALAWEAECFGYGCLDLVAAMAREQVGKNEAVDVAMTGGHGEYFFQQFGGDGVSVNLPISLPSKDVIATSTSPIFAGDVCDLFAPSLPDICIADILPKASCWPLIADHAPLPPSASYGRAPDAKPMTAL